MQQDLNATRLLSQGGEERESSSLQNFPIRYPDTWDFYSNENTREPMDGQLTIANDSLTKVLLGA